MGKSPGFPPACSWLQKSNGNLPPEGLASHLAVTQSASTSPIRAIGGGLSRQGAAAGTPSGAEPLAEAKINKLLGLKVLIKKC